MSDQPDPFDLNRFVKAQAGTYDDALLEIRRGRKRGHWMWYIFPQMAGLGRSAMSDQFAIHSLTEARAYLAHPVLGPRLLVAVRTLHELADTTAEAVFGTIDAMKLCSSLTLFETAGSVPELADSLNRWFNGEADGRTIELIAMSQVR